MEERRFFKRVGYDELIRCNIIRQGNLFDAITTSVDISGGGIRVQAHEELESPQNISLELFVPGYGRSIAAKGEVVWKGGSDQKEDWLAGVRFTSIDAYDRQMILDYVHFG